MSVAVALPLLMWLPPLPNEVPEQFRGNFALNPEQCDAAQSSSRMDVDASFIEWAGERRTVEELFLIDPEKLAVRLSALAPRAQKATDRPVPLDPTPTGEPTTMLVMSKRGDTLEIGIAKTLSSDGQFSLSFARCGGASADRLAQ